MLSLDLEIKIAILFFAPCMVHNLKSLFCKGLYQKGLQLLLVKGRQLTAEGLKTLTDFLLCHFPLHFSFFKEHSMTSLKSSNGVESRDLINLLYDFKSISAL